MTEMTEFLILLLTQLTVFSSITALVIIAVKQIFKCRIPPLIGMIMWIVLLARLICPIFPESKVSIYNLIPAGRKIMYSLTNDISEEIDFREAEKMKAENPYVIASVPEENAEPSPRQVASDKNSDSPVTIGEYLINDVGDDATHSAATINCILLGIYLAGIAVTSGISGYLYQRAKRRAHYESFFCDDNELLSVYYSAARKIGINPNKIPPLRYGGTSMLVGCISPEIVCREGMDKREASFVFAHELSHYKHGDNPLILFSTLVACLFWYNPLIWIVRNILREDIEVLCDSRTMECFEISSSEYAMMIYKNSVSSNKFAEAGCHMSAAGRSLKNRLRTISHNKNKKFLPKIASGVLCAVIIAICLTNPIISQNSDYAGYIENYADISGTDESALYLSSHTSVSAYLNQLATLLEKKCAAEFKTKIGNGSLEKFKRIVSELDYIDSEVAREVHKLRTDEPLNAEACAVINYCITIILSEGAEPKNMLSVLPQYITNEDMSKVLLNLSEAEGRAVMSWYNKGVRGADVEFDRYYTSAMMDLITSRINDGWNREKFKGFYSKIEYEDIKESYCSDEIENITKRLKNKSSFYVLDPNINKSEESLLRMILGAAVAGQREDVYYLKKCADGCSAEIAEFLFKRGGYNAENMIDGYAKVGETAYTYLTSELCEILSSEEINTIDKRLEGTGYIFSDYTEPIFDDGGVRTGYFKISETESDKLAEIFNLLNKVNFTIVREGEPFIKGAASESVRESIYDTYSLGLIDSEDGIIELSRKLSCGESLYYAYKLVSSMTNLY